MFCLILSGGSYSFSQTASSIWSLSGNALCFLWAKNSFDVELHLYVRGVVRLNLWRQRNANLWRQRNANLASPIWRPSVAMETMIQHAYSCVCGILWRLCANEIRYECLQIYIQWKRVATCVSEEYQYWMYAVCVLLQLSQTNIAQNNWKCSYLSFVKYCLLALVIKYICIYIFITLMFLAKK